MKKIVSIALSLIMLMQLLPTSASDIGKKNTIASQSFDSLATNYVPSDEITLSGEGVAYVAETKAGENKALKMSLKSSAKTAAFKVAPISGMATYSFELMDGAGIATTVSILSAAGSGTSIFTISAEGDVAVVNGPKLSAALSPDAMRKFTIFVDSVTKRISIYAGSVALLGNWYASGISDQTAGISIAATENADVKSALYVDSFVAGYGFNSRLSATKEKYNPSVLDAIAEPGDTVEGPVSTGDAILLNTNFDTEESMAGIQLGSTNELVYDERRGNGYIHMKQGAESTRLDALLDGTRYLVIEADFSADTSGASGQIFMFNNGAYCYILKLTSAGAIQTYSGSRDLCTLQKNKWNTVSVVCDFEEMVFDAYVNKKLVTTNCPMQASQTGPLTRLRAVSLNAGSGAFLFDNLRVYEGTELRDLSGESTQREEKSIMPDGSEATSLLGESKAIDLRSGAIYNGSEKTTLANAATKKDGVVYASPAAISALFGTEKSFSDGIEYNGESYAPLEDVCKSFNKTLYVDDRDFCIIGDNLPSFTDSQLWKIHDYMLYARPEPEEVLAAFNQNMAGVHPRVIITQKDIEEIKYNYNTKDYYKNWVDTIIADADRYLTAEYYSFDEATGSFSSGARRGIRDRVIYLGIAYFMTGDLKYPQRAYNELVSAGNFKHWRHDIEYLDTAEMMVTFAIGYDWFFDVWTDTQKKWIADTVMEKGMKHSRANYYGVATGTSTWWSTTDTNWNACCNHGTTAAAIALMDEYPELCSDLVSKALRGAEPMLRNFYPSGAWFEGTGYYSYIMEHMSMWVNSLKNSFGTDYNLMKAPSLDISGDYIIAIDGPVASNNFHDASEGHSIPPTLSFLATTYDKMSYCGERLNAIEFYGSGVHFFDILYWPTEFERGAKADLPKDLSFGTTELAVMRSEYSNPEATYLSYHAGAVVEQHSHVDAGTFVMDMSGVRWAIDLGADDYNADGYFEQYGRRNNYYRVRAEGHNCVVIDPDESSGQNLYAFMPIKSLESGESSAFSTVDLTPAYNTSTKSYIRGFMIGENRRTITVRDEFEFMDSGHELYWFMHTRAEIEIVDDNTAILTSKGKRLKAQLLTDIEGAKFSVMKAEPLPTSPDIPQMSNGTAIKLTVHGENIDGSKYIQVRFSDMDDELSNITPTNMPISTWTVDNTPFTTRPVATDIKADGVTLDGFNGKVTSYLVPVPYRTRHMPTITATAPDGCAIEITPAPDVYGNTVVRVYRLDNPTDSRNYYLSYQLQITAEDQQYVPISVKASREPEIENPGVNATDGNLNTRWSADGEGEWLQLEFAQSVPVKLIRVAAMNATTRRTKFDIEVSEDGVNWTKIIEHETDGITPGYEYMECDAQGKYVRLYGHGNSVNEWNSILEFGVIDTTDW